MHRPCYTILTLADTLSKRGFWCILTVKKLVFSWFSGYLPILSCFFNEKNFVLIFVFFKYFISIIDKNTIKTIYVKKTDLCTTYFRALFFV